VATAERAAMTTNSLRRCVKSTVHLARAGSAPEASSPGDVVAVRQEEPRPAGNVTSPDRRARL
jgi:hypothetical protein